MQLSQEQLEWIVSEVVRRLRGDRPVVAQPTPPQASEITLNERLVTTATLRGRLSGVRRVNVAKRAVVTPAVVDLLKENKIEFIRSG